MTEDQTKITIRMGGSESLEEQFYSAYHFFMSTLHILGTSNEMLQKTVREYTQSTKIRIDNDVIALDEEGKKELDKFINDSQNLKEGDTVTVSNKSVVKILNDRMELGMLSKRIPKFIREMSLVYLITNFEQFLAYNLEIIFWNKPEILKTEKKKITYGEVFSHEDMQNLKSRIIQKEIISIVNDDVEEITKYLKKRFSLDLSKEEDWKQFKEYFYRRNLLIHNKLIVNEKYRAKTGYKDEEQQLSIDSEYLQTGIKIFEKYSEIIREHFLNAFAPKTK